MAGETILVIDADREMEQRMTSALEAESYLLYPVSSQDLNAESIGLLVPSLIYIKLLDLSPTGLKPCKAIRAIPLLKKVPIIILTSLKKTPGPEELKEYGVAGFLDLNFSSEELIEKTEAILGKTIPSFTPKEDESIALPRPPGKTTKERSPFLLPGVGIAILLVLVVVGYMAYQQFMPARVVSSSSTATGIIRVPPPGPKAGPKSQPAPGSKVAATAAPASPAAPTPPGPGLKPQPAPETKVAAKAAPVSPVAPTPPGPGSKPQPTPETKGAKTAAAVSPIPSTPPGNPSSVSSESVSRPTSKPFCSAQLGAFKKEQIAEALAKKFREKGYDAFTHLGVTKNGAPIYRVLVGRFEDRKAARKLGLEIQSKEEIETSVYSE